jgi:hypothetical protein
MRVAVMKESSRCGSFSLSFFPQEEAHSHKFCVKISFRHSSRGEREKERSIMRHKSRKNASFLFFHAFFNILCMYTQKEAAAASFRWLLPLKENDLFNIASSHCAL